MDGLPERHHPVTAGDATQASDESDESQLPAGADLGPAIDIMVSETGGALAGVGLTHAQFVLLLSVSEFEPVSLDVLGRIMAVGQQRSQSELEPLLDKGAVQFRDADAAERFVVTTAHGRNLLQRAIPLWEAAQDRIQDRLGVVRGDSGELPRTVKPSAVG